MVTMKLIIFNNSHHRQSLSSITISMDPEMPMPGGNTQRRLLKALQQDSLYRLAREIPHLARELQGLAGFTTKRTVQALSSDSKNNWEAVMLLHSMPRSVLQAVIRGTVAHDTYSNAVEWYKEPSENDGKVPGVYVVGLRRDGNSGKFLSAVETEALIRSLNDYAQGAAVLNRLTPPSSWTPAALALVQWVDRVDGQSQPNAIPSVTLARDADAARQKKEPFTWPTALFAELVKDLALSFKKRLLPNLARADRMVRQIQSPLYVGCSTDLRSRMTKYQQSHKPREINKPLRCLWAVLHVLGCPVSLTARVALLIWKPKQLTLAEQLVATLAQSLLPQTGFNATEAGGNDFKSNNQPSALVMTLAKQVVLGSEHMRPAL